MTQSLSPGREALLWKLVCVVLWAAEELVAGILIERYSAFQIVWVRFASQLALMALLWGRSEPMRLVRTARPVLQVARAALMVAMPAFWLLALQNDLSPQTLMALFWTSPLLLLLCAHVLLRERAPSLLWLGAALACLGANLFFSHDRIPTATAALAALGMALAFALFVVATRALRHEPLRANLFYTAAGVLVLLLPLLPGRWTWPGATDLALMVSVGLLGFGALYALERMAAAAPVSLTAPATGLQLLPSIGAAWAAGQYAWDGHATAGALIVIAVALWLWWLDPRVAQLPGGVPVLRVADDAGRD